MSYNNTHDDNNISNNNMENSISPIANNFSLHNLRNAPKRNRESLQNSLYDNASKTPRLSISDSPFKLLNIIDKRFENMLAKVGTLLAESESRMEKLFDKRFDELKRDLLDINHRVTKLETVADDIISLTDEVKMLKTQLQRQENSLIASDLRINGIPFMDNENLFDIFNSICGQLKINTPAIKSIYRLQNYNNKHNAYSPDAVIMVKLFSPYGKNFVLKSVSSFRKTKNSPLLLNLIGFNSDRPFYVNENLTSSNHKILKSATARKKTKQLYSAYTMRGLVYVKLDKNEKPIRIDSAEELENLFRSN